MNKKTILLVLFTALTLSACNNSTNTSSSIVKPVSLQTAINNTKYYNLYFTPDENTDSNHYQYVEIYSPTDYCYLNENIGHVVLDDDPDYTHQYSIAVDDDYYVMTMHGRVGNKDYCKSYIEEMTTFMEILDYNQSYFTVNETDPFLYQYYGNEISTTFKNFFQIHSFAYCNYFEVKINEQGRIEQFNAGETYYTDHSDLVYTELFTLGEGGIKNTRIYQDWVDNNKLTEIRIYDLKSLSFNDNGVSLCYKEGTISAVVTNIDYDGSFYIALNDQYTGPVGMKVKKAVSCSYVPKIYDYVTVSGKIKLSSNINDKEAFSPYFYDAQVSKISEVFYTPMFSEESLVDQNGPGVYAAYLLSNSPIFSGSLYTAYAYVNNVPTITSYQEDIIIGLVCPDYEKDEIGSAFTMNLVLPAKLGEEKIKAILAEIDTLGDFNNVEVESKLLMMQNCLFYFDFKENANGKLGANIYVTNYSTVSHRLSFKEMVENEYGIVNFPDIESENTLTFHFGESSGYYLESFYGSNEHTTSGVFHQVSCSDTEIDAYLTTINSYDGMNFIDGYQYSFSTGFIHYVYQYHDVYIDIIPDYDNSGILFFIYRNDCVVRSKTINEKINEYCSSFFDVNDFVKLDNTYDYNYHLYALSSYAGHQFDENNKLVVATMDLIDDRYQELRNAYREKGYKQYREDLTDQYSKAYSYITRGVSHVVYYKENTNGKYTFLDFASYPTSDYTFRGHSSFNYRVEILIYEGNEPLNTLYTNNLDEFISYCVSEHGQFSWTLPSEYKAEIYYQQNYEPQNKFIDYGYTFNTDAFIYPSSLSELDDCYNYCISIFLQHGFTYSHDGQKGVCYTYNNDSDNMFGFPVYLMKDSRGFVRIINSIGGVDF